MSSLKESIRYSSEARKLFYKLLKILDKIPVYKTLYNNKISKSGSHVDEFPRELSIETTNLCNARCTICPHPRMKRAKGKMTTELVKNLIEQAAGHNVGKLFLSGFGEPLIDSRIPEFVAYAKDRKIENISIVTNGYLLRRELARELIDSGLNELIISIDGFTSGTYESIRLGLKFDRLVENIKALSMLDNRQKVNVSISCVDLIHNRNEHKQAKSTFGGYVDAIYFRQAQGWTGEFDRAKAGYSPHFDTNDIPCRYLWDSMSVYFDGTVPACCLDYEAEGIMGNAGDNSLKDIWQGDNYRQYRNYHLGNRKNDLSPCNKCGYYSVWW